MAACAQHPLLAPFLPGLASRDRAKRVDARRKFIGYIYARAGDRPPAAFTALLKELGVVGKQLVDTCTDVRDITTGFYVLDCLADIADDSQVERRLRFLFDILHYLEQDRPLPEAVIRVAGECVGHLSRDASATEMEFLREQYMPTCLAWLRDKRSESRRTSSLVLLHEIAVHSPTLFYDEKRSFFDDVRATLVDPKQAIREAAAEALSAFLTVVHEREGSTAYFHELLREATTQLTAKSGFAASLTTASGNTMHGALLVLQAVLLSCKRPREVLTDEEYDHICEQVLSKLNSSSSTRAVRHTVLSLLPRLAMVDVTSFWYHFSSRITQHLLACILKKGGEDQGPAYLSLGNLALVMGPSIFMSATSSSATATSSLAIGEAARAVPGGGLSKKPTHFSFQVVMGAIHEGLSASGLSGGGAFSEAMACLSMIMRVSADVKENSAALQSMMPSLFRRGVTRALVETLEALSPRISADCRRNLQVLLLSEITSVLLRFCHISHPHFSPHATTTSSSNNNHPAPPSSSSSSTSIIASASYSSMTLTTTTTQPTGPSPRSSSTLDLTTHRNSMTLTATTAREMLSKSPSSGTLERATSLSASSSTTTTAASTAAGLLASTASAWSVSRLFSSIQQPKDDEKPADADTVLLCLQTLSHFDFYTGNEEQAYQAMTSLTRTVLVRLLHEQDPYIRKTAGLTVATLLNKVARSGGKVGLSAHKAHALIKQALHRLLTAGMADHSVDIRAAIFGSLSPTLDPFLASPVNVTIIATAANDEALEVRQHAIKCLARITRQDPPRILPMLRKIWVTLMELVTLGSAKAAQESLQLVQSLLQVEPSLVKPYVHAFVRQVFSMLDSSSSSSSDHHGSSGGMLPAAISVVGELAVINPDDVRPFVHVLMPRLLDSLRGSTTVLTASKEASMRALGQLCGATGVVVQSYQTYPDLYPVLLDILQRGDEASLHLRREAIRTLGILGALSPALYLDTTTTTAQQTVKPSSSTNGAGGGRAGESGKERAEEKQEADMQGGSTQLLPLPELCPVMVLRALMSILRDPQASSQYPTALQTAMLVCKRVSGQPHGARPVWRPPLARFVMLGLSEALQRQDLSPDFKVSLLEQFAVLIEIIGQQQSSFTASSSNNPPSSTQPQATTGGTGSGTFAVRDHLDLITRVVKDHWESQLSLALSIVVKVWLSLGEMDFRLFMSEPVLPLMIATITADKAQAQPRTRTLEVLNCLGKLRTCLTHHFRQILPELLFLIRDPSNKHTQKAALQLLVHSTEEEGSSSLQDFSNLIIHTLLNLLSTPDIEVHRLAMNALLLMISRLRLRFIPYVLSVRKVVVAYCRAYPVFDTYLSTYDALLLKLLKGRPLPTEAIGVDNPWSSSEGDKRVAMQTLRSKTALLQDSLTVKRSALEAVWDSSGYTTTSDWSEWLRRLSVELIRQSPSTILRPCSALAQVHPSLAMGLFDVAFLSVWNELQQHGNLKPWEAPSMPLVDSLEQTLRSPSLPPEVLNKLLNLVEFMELRDRPLPIDIRLLGAQSERAQAYAKCLKYREMEYRQADPTPDCLEALISVYNQLGLREAAMGILRRSEVTKGGGGGGGGVAIRPSWLEKIHQWEKALSLYEAYTDQHEDDELSGSGGRLPSSSARERRSSLSTQKHYGIASSASGRHWKISSSGEMVPSSGKGVTASSSGGSGHHHSTSVALQDLDLVEAKVGKLRCLDALGDYHLLLEEAKGLKQRLNRQEYRSKPKWREWVMQVLLLGTKAAFSLGQWQDMSDFMSTRSRVLPNEGFMVEDDPMVYEAMLKIVRNDFLGAQDCIERMRSRLAPVVSSLLRESYTRVYRCMLTAQQLAELEEVIQYKRTCQSSGGPSSLPAQSLLKHLKHKWDERFHHASQDIKVLRRMLATRSMILRPSEDLQAWLHLANACRRSGALTLCGNVLQSAGAVLPSFAATSEVATVVSLDEELEGLGDGAQADDDDRRMPSSLRYAVCKFLWAANHRPYALDKMLGLSRDLEARRGGLSAGPPEEESSSVEVEALLGKVYVRIGEWSMGLNGDDLERPVMEEVMGYLQKATELCSQSYKAWHSWARMNNHMVEKIEAMAQSRQDKEQQQQQQHAQEDRGPGGGAMGESEEAESEAKAKAKVKQQAAVLREAAQAKYAAQAIRGFLRSISLGQNANQRTAYILQDTLRLFTLWFRHGKQRVVSQEIEAGLEGVSVSTWLGVVPQLIARIDSTSGPVSSLIRRLLVKVGRSHPQALIYPITLAANSTNEARKDAALAVMADMRTHSALLVDEAEMVSREMINVAITRQELWHEGLEEASRLYYGEKDVRAALQVLEGLHKIGAQPPSTGMGMTGSSSLAGSISSATVNNNLCCSSSGALDLSGARSGSADDWNPSSAKDVETIRTVSFYHCFEREVEEAKAWLHAYKKSRADQDICQAWEIYCSIFRQITKHLSGLKTLDLRHVAPALLQARDLRLAVPGTYTPDSEVVRIASFQASVLVLASKQRPRRLSMLGSDGKEYMFLLKGHEDLRQDERVMQLFGLINVLLVNDQSTSRSNLRITRYAVMPLSSNSGIIGWVRNCDTMHQLIKDYRDSQRIRLNAEHRLILGAAPDYDKLPLPHKCEVFMEALSQTRGLELSKMLWLKSSSSEEWLERRTNYARSLAVMSMAGYILGLGDRHPSNLMLDRLTGRIVHIDFGDCFEVAMTRSKFPETVPFRLTRMLINAMEAGGIEGSFRITCENVMEVLRGNRDSLMAMLEAFVHDPLISWRLLAVDGNASFEDRANPDAMLPPPEQPTGRQDMAKTVPRALDGGEVAPAQVASLGDSGINPAVNQQQVNKRALAVIQRIQTKLIGRDFGEETLTVPEQVERLIQQATSVENLCQLFMGWCPFW